MEKTMPAMEDGKCKENCSWRDEYGFCSCGDDCIKYGVNNVTGAPLAELKEETYEEPHRSNLDVNLVTVQNILGQQLLTLANGKLTAKQREEARANAREITAISAQYMKGIDLMLKGYALMSNESVEKEGVRGLIE